MHLHAQPSPFPIGQGGGRFGMHSANHCDSCMHRSMFFRGSNTSLSLSCEITGVLHVLAQVAISLAPAHSPYQPVTGKEQLLLCAVKGRSGGDAVATLVLVRQYCLLYSVVDLQSIGEDMEAALGPSLSSLLAKTWSLTMRWSCHNIGQSPTDEGKASPAPNQK